MAPTIPYHEPMDSPFTGWNYHKFGHYSIGKDINPKEYLSPVAPNWLGRYFAIHAGARMEGDIRKTSYEGKNKFGAVPVN